jgi:hypothetical protein
MRSGNAAGYGRDVGNEIAPPAGLRRRGDPARSGDEKRTVRYIDSHPAHDTLTLATTLRSAAAAVGMVAQKARIIEETPSERGASRS